jgi:pimeloyl-ACP methyl ester carboxylesterase
MLRQLMVTAALLAATGCATMQQAAPLGAAARPGAGAGGPAQPFRQRPHRGAGGRKRPGRGADPRAGFVAARLGRRHRGQPGRRYHVVQLNGFAGLPVGGAAQGPVAAPAAEEIARYIREAGLKKPAVIGHSMGGTMA